MFSFIARHKVASALIFLNVVAILVVTLVIVLHNAKTATIDIFVAPSEATIELNGGKYDNFQPYDIMPGNYHVKISMEGMQTKEFDFEIYDGEFKRVWAYLLDAEGGFGYYLENPDEITYLEEVADDEEAKKFIAEYKKIVAIKDKLPLQRSSTFDPEATELVSINIEWGEGDQCEEKAFCLMVMDYTGKNYAVVLDMIREAGFNPDDYEIVYEKGVED